MHFKREMHLLYYLPTHGITQSMPTILLNAMVDFRASETYGIPATTLWQRANRMGIATPKKETTNKTW